jgi:hypothetical protein
MTDSQYMDVLIRAVERAAVTQDTAEAMWRARRPPDPVERDVPYCVHGYRAPDDCYRCLHDRRRRPAWQAMRCEHGRPFETCRTCRAARISERELFMAQLMSEPVLYDRSGSPVMCGHANEVPSHCECQPSCYCKVRGTCAARCRCGHWPSDHMPMGRGEGCRRCRCAQYTLPESVAEEATMGQVAPQAPPRVENELCSCGHWLTMHGGACSGYNCECQAFDRPLAPRTPRQTCECGHGKGRHKGDGACTAAMERTSDTTNWCPCEAYQAKGSPPKQADAGGQRAMRLRE